MTLLSTAGAMSVLSGVIGAADAETLMKAHTAAAPKPKKNFRMDLLLQS